MESSRPHKNSHTASSQIHPLHPSTQPYARLGISSYGVPQNIEYRGDNVERSTIDPSSHCSRRPTSPLTTPSIDQKTSRPQHQNGGVEELDQAKNVLIVSEAGLIGEPPPAIDRGNFCW